MQLSNVLLLLERELQGAWRNRWFLAYSVVFLLMALGFAWLSVVGVTGAGFAGLGRTAASLVNLVVLIVPLMGLSLGAGAIAGERERGTLLYLFTQPLDLVEILVGKFLGISLAVATTVLVGFGLAGLVISTQGGRGEIVQYLQFLALALLVAIASVSLGLLVSCLASRASVATGVTLVLWLGLVLLGDLGLMGTSLVLEMDPPQLLAAALLNPLQVFKLAAIATIRGGLDVLGPAGRYATQVLGSALVPALLAILVLWIAVPLAAAAAALKRRGALA